MAKDDAAAPDNARVAVGGIDFTGRSRNSRPETGRPGPWDTSCWCSS